jgi:hypothetical protein
VTEGRRADPPTGVVTLVYADSPPSFNKTRYASRFVVQASFKKWVTIFEQLLVGAQVPVGCDRIRARAILYFARGHGGRDEDNYRTPIAKALGDALTGSTHGYWVPEPKNKSGKSRRRVYPDGRWLPDDKPAHFKFGSVVFERDPELGVDAVTGRKLTRNFPSRTEIRLAYWL